MCTCANTSQCWDQRTSDRGPEYLLYLVNRGICQACCLISTHVVEGDVLSLLGRSSELLTMLEKWLTLLEQR